MFSKPTGAFFVDAQGAGEVEVAFGDDFYALGGIFIDVATIWQVIWAHAASAPRSRSPEQAALPEPPAPA
jgi:hypothetical protein